MVTIRVLLLAIVTWQYYSFLLLAPSSVVQGYMMIPFALRSKRIYSLRVLRALSNGDTPSFDQEYEKSIKNDKQKSEDFINAAEIKKQVLADEQKELDKLVGSASYYDAVEKVVVGDTYHEAKANGTLEQYVHSIKYDKEKLEDYIKNANKDLKILLLQGKVDELDRLIFCAILFLGNIAQYVDSIKNDRDKLTVFISNAAMDMQMAKQQGKEDERDRWTEIVTYAFSFFVKSFCS